MTALEVGEFLLVGTPKTWVSHALKYQQILLIDHANCERKAASSALSMIYRATPVDVILLFNSRRLFVRKCVTSNKCWL